jgi:tyramine---L-glutamate ligase
MRIFVYEYITGGGLRSPAGGPASSLLAEGEAMLVAMVADFGAMEGVEVVTTRDVCLETLRIERCEVTPISNAKAEQEAFRRLARDCDWTLVIAPETDGVLLERCNAVEAAGGRLISPMPSCVAIAGDKQRTAELLGRLGVPTARGALLEWPQRELPAGFLFPAVVKPVDGCGSQGVRLVRSGEELLEQRSEIALRVEEHVRGLAASAAVLCGPSGNHALPACEQRLSSDGRFSYLGGRLPLENRLDARARRLALAAVGALPSPSGYVGVDLVLGEAANGSEDRVIEINPRLTTSYVGLRSLAQTNLAAAMLAVVEGRQPDLCFGDRRVEFDANGTVITL